MTLDQTIEQIAEANENPALRDDLVADIWNSTLGQQYESVAAVDAAIAEGSDVALIADVRYRLGLPIFE